MVAMVAWRTGGKASQTKSEGATTGTGQASEGGPMVTGFRSRLESLRVWWWWFTCGRLPEYRAIKRASERARAKAKARKAQAHENEHEHEQQSDTGPRVTGAGRLSLRR